MTRCYISKELLQVWNCDYPAAKRILVKDGYKFISIGKINPKCGTGFVARYEKDNGSNEGLGVFYTTEGIFEGTFPTKTIKGKVAT